MKITISGPPGSGKSTVAEGLAEKLGFRHYSAGDIRRELAAKKGMSLEEFNRLDENTHEGDKTADEFIKKIEKEKDNFVIDGRIPFYFIPDSIRIFLWVDPKVGAERVMGKRRDVEKYADVDYAMKKLAEREASDSKRYKELYGIENYTDRGHFDLIIDTTNTNTDEIVGKILEFIDKRRQQAHPKPL